MDISVLIATYNRAEDLRETLESMTRLDREGIAVEFVVVDNNSSDNTKQVIESFTDRLPIRYLFEPRSGKNCALNRALEEVKLGEIVVFTDDDCSPWKDWFRAILSVSKRWPGHSVFGGKIDVLWPNVKIPGWARSPLILKVGFAAHDYAGSEGLYSPGYYPFGGNFWVRRAVFQGRRRFNEAVGPRPRDRIMGSEATFLRELANDGYAMVFSPAAVVEHRLHPEQVTLSALARRAYRWGRLEPHLNGLPRVDLLEKHPILWRLLRVAFFAPCILRFAGAMMTISSVRRIERCANAIRWTARNIESLRLAGKNKPAQ